MQLSHLTSAEEHLMQLLWKLNTFYMRDVMEQHPEPKPHQNTVSTYLKILAEKSFLTTTKEGRIFRYQVAIPISEYRKFLLSGLLENYYNNSPEELINSLDLKAKILENSHSNSEIFNSENTTKINPITEFIQELTEPKKKKKEKKKKDKKKRKK